MDHQIRLGSGGLGVDVRPTAYDWCRTGHPVRAAVGYVGHSGRVS